MKINDHMDITEYAVDLYWMFSPTELADEFKANLDNIRDGARYIENGVFSNRRRTLHFYNHNDKLKPKRVKLFGTLPIYTLYPTAEHSLKDYIQELQQDMLGGISKNGYILIGKILHLVQDMSSPANVVPVYHSDKQGDSFEARLNSRLSLYLSHFNYSQDRFNRIYACKANGNCIEGVYQGAALNTLKHIHSPNSEFKVEINGETRNAGWDLFWQSDQRTGTSFHNYGLSRMRGFGSYGPLGKHFGREQVDIRKDTYVVSKDIYDDLCNHIVKKSIEDSLKVLVCIENNLKQA